MARLQGWDRSGPNRLTVQISTNALLRSRQCSANVLLGAGPRRGQHGARVSTVAFEGVEARPVDVQVQIARERSSS